MKVTVLSLFLFFPKSYTVQASPVLVSAEVDDQLAETFESVQQQKRVTGVVTEKDGTPLAGVTVVVTGTTQGTITGQNGEYSIDVPAGATSITFSFIGMETQEISIGTSAQINVTMSELSIGLDEVVVVGYGSQKRRDVVGAIEQVSGKIFENRSNPNIVRSMQGEIPGLTITMLDGKPIRSANIQIRGAINSIGAGGDALVLIDGVEGDLTTINPEDVASISVLKDASSTAVYGARGSFGVVLITTKKAVAGKPQISYSGSVSLMSRTVKPEIVTNGLQWTDTFYESYYNYKGIYPSTINNVFNKYTVSWSDWYNELVNRDANPSLDKVRINNRGYYDYFGNTDWHAIIYKNSTLATKHNINMSGGNNVATYLLSASYYDQDGVYNAGNENFKRYNLRAKGSVVLRPWLKLENNTDFFLGKYHEPIVMYSNSSTDYTQIFPIQRQMEQQAYPMALERNPDGTWTEHI
jgi:TonB-linked SusC/RagA family outer membrane protein